MSDTASGVPGSGGVPEAAPPCPVSGMILLEMFNQQRGAWETIRQIGPTDNAAGQFEWARKTWPHYSIRVVRVELYAMPRGKDVQPG